MAVSSTHFPIIFYILQIGNDASCYPLPETNTTGTLPGHSNPHKLDDTFLENRNILINPDYIKSNSALDEVKANERLFEPDDFISQLGSTLSPSGSNILDYGTRIFADEENTSAFIPVTQGMEMVSVTNTVHIGSDTTTATDKEVSSGIVSIYYNYTPSVSTLYSTRVYDPNCAGIELDVSLGIVHCSDSLGNSHRPFPVETTSPMTSTYSTPENNESFLDTPDFSAADVDVVLVNDGLNFQMICRNWKNCPEENETITLSNPCCIQCDCSDTCVRSGSCCLDKKHTNIGQRETKADDTHTSKQKASSKTTQTCIKTFVGDENSNMKIRSTHTYMLTQACLEEDGIYSDVLSKCIQPNETKLDEVVPFYSTRSGRNYRNVYCAECNKDSVYGSHWESYFSCPIEVVTLPLRRTIEKMNDIVSATAGRQSTAGSCLLYWEPATSEIEYCIEQNTLISNCYNTENSRLCPEYFAPVRGNNGVYRNFYCLVCNEEVTDLVCDDKHEQEGFFVTKLPLGELLAQVDTNKAISENQINVHVKCDRGLIYHYGLNECILKACAITQMKIGEKCFSITEELSGISLDFRMTILLPPATFPKIDSVLDTVRSLSLMPNDEGNCIERIIETVEEDRGVSIKTQIIKHVRTLRNIHEDFKAFAEQVFQFNKKAAEVNAPIKVEITKQALSPVNEKFLSFGVFSDNSNYAAVNCGRQFAMTDIQFCETVLMHDVIFYFNGTVRSAGATFVPGEYVVNTYFEALNVRIAFLRDESIPNKSVYVCYGLYVSRVLGARGNGSKNTVLDTSVNNGATKAVASGFMFCSLLHVTTELVILLTYRHS